LSKPDLIILGQITIDHVVPAMPGPWSVQVGGNALYAAAGARLWMDPAAIGLVFRRGRDFPVDVEAVLARAGISHVLRRDVDKPHLVEWIIYEADGSRRCLPKNDGLRHIGSEGGSGDIEAYFDYLLQFSPEAADLPGDWLPAKAIHLAPQVRERQITSLRQLAGQQRGHASESFAQPSRIVPFRYESRGID
jgi:ribokinase